MSEITEELNSKIWRIAVGNAKQRGLSEEDGKEIAQDVLIIIWQKEIPPDDPVAYACRIIFRKIAERKKKNKEEDLEDIVLSAEPEPEYDLSYIKEINECIEQCCARQSDEDFQKIVDYYTGFDGKQDRKHRVNMAGKMRTSYDALRVRIHRVVSSSIRPCVESCCKRKPNARKVITDATSQQLNKFIREYILQMKNWPVSES